MADCARDQLVDLDRLLTNVQLMVACICFSVFMEFFIACFGDCLFGLGCYIIFHCSNCNCLFSTEADTVTYLNFHFTAQEQGEARRMTGNLTPPRGSPPRHLRRRRERSRSR